MPAPLARRNAPTPQGPGLGQEARLRMRAVRLQGGLPAPLLLLAVGGMLALAQAAGTVLCREAFQPAVRVW